jgi:alpha-aminoadipate carrier protein LysW
MNPQDNKIVCPDCEAEITKPQGMEVGDILECQECGTEVEIQSIDPLVYGELIEEK